MTAQSGEEARANGRNYSSYDTGMCQKFVRGPCWEVGSLYGSAIEAWNGAREKHPGDRTPPVGAPCYYRGGNYGHAVIYVGNGNVRSTDTPSTGSVGEKPLSYYEQAWGYEFLGWTGDINGVDLPLGEDGGGEEDEVKEEDIAAIAARVNRVLGDYNSKGEPDSGDAEYADNRIRQIENKVDRILEKLNKK